jgi:hypothetical protein
LNAYSRDPYDFTHMPAVECLKALLRRWEGATIDKGLTTLLYEDQDAVEEKDYDLVLKITEKL